jgi:hypothetical protein
VKEEREREKEGKEEKEEEEEDVYGRNRRERETGNGRVNEVKGRQIIKETASPGAAAESSSKEQQCQ